MAWGLGVLLWTPLLTPSKVNLKIKLSVILAVKFFFFFFTEAQKYNPGHGSYGRTTGMFREQSRGGSLIEEGEIF